MRPPGRILIYILVFTLVFWCVLVTSPLAQEPVGEVVVAVGDADWPPFQWVDLQRDEVTGIWHDISQVLFVERMGLEVEFHPLPWKRAQHDLEFGAADVIFAIPTGERRGYARVSEVPVAQIHLSLFTYAGHPDMDKLLAVRTIEDILDSGFMQVSNFGNGWTRSNLADKGVPTYWVNSDINVVRFLADRRADFAIDEAVSFQNIVKEAGLEQHIVRTDAMFSSEEMYMLVGKSSPLADRLPEINRLLRQMRSDGTLGAIVEKYRRTK